MRQRGVPGGEATCRQGEQGGVRHGRAHGHKRRQRERSGKHMGRRKTSMDECSLGYERMGTGVRGQVTRRGQRACVGTAQGGRHARAQGHRRRPRERSGKHMGRKKTSMDECSLGYERIGTGARGHEMSAQAWQAGLAGGRTRSRQRIDMVADAHRKNCSDNGNCLRCDTGEQGGPSTDVETGNGGGGILVLDDDGSVADGERRGGGREEGPISIGRPLCKPGRHAKRQRGRVRAQMGHLCVTSVAQGGHRAGTG